MITVLTGPNTYAIAEALRAKVSTFHGEVERFDGAELDVRQLPDLFMGASLFAAQRLIVLREVSSNKSLWGELEQWVERVPAETEIVMIESHPDKRTKTYKTLQKHGRITEHALLNEAAMRSWLQAWARQQGAALEPDVASYLLSYVGHDQWRLKAELEKLMLSEQAITRERIQDIAEPYPESTAFELLDSVFSGDQARAERLLAELREREDPYQFFGLLSSQIMALLALVTAGSRQSDEIARDMGLHPFVVRKLSAVARTLGRGRIVALVGKLANADSRIKRGADPWRQLETTLLGI